MTKIFNGELQYEWDIYHIGDGICRSGEEYLDIEIKEKCINMVNKEKYINMVCKDLEDSIIHMYDKKEKQVYNEKGY